MTNLNPKNISFFLILFLFSMGTVRANQVEQLLQRADSLFVSAKYTQALELYEQVLIDFSSFSPAMLLKMAYIHEGLEEPYESLFYLEQYYKFSKDPAAILKIGEMANKLDLRGYETTDAGIALRLYDRYYKQLAGIALAMGVFLFSVLGFRFRKFGERPVPVWIGMIVFLLVSFLAINRVGLREYGMLTGQETILIMSGPSSGSDLLEEVNMGHKVAILGKEETWTRIKWKQREAYVRSGLIKML